MDTVRNKEKRRFTKVAWCEKWGKDSRKKARSRSKKIGEAGATSKTCTDIKQAEKVAPVGAWMFAAALVVAVLLLGVK